MFPTTLRIVARRTSKTHTFYTLQSGTQLILTQKSHAKVGDIIRVNKGDYVKERNSIITDDIDVVVETKVRIPFKSGLASHNEARGRNRTLAILLSNTKRHLLPIDATQQSSADVHNSQDIAETANLPALANNIRLKSKVQNGIRQFLNKRNFLEVETPILSSSAGGAVATPFWTSSVALGSVALRIAPELYLKQLIVAGFDKVFEIGKVFRNEGVDISHYPEFTTVEFYQANSSLEEMKVTTERLLNEIWTLAPTPAKLPPFKTIHILEFISKHLNMRLEPADPDFNALLQKLCLAFLPQLESNSTPYLIDQLIAKYIEPECIAPTFLQGFLVESSPLASALPSSPLIADRFELYMNGIELANAYQELNDPDEQLRRFQSQSVDGRVSSVDLDFVEALKIGMPPTTGFGMGIDRVVMMLSGSTHLKDVLAFPIVKEKKMKNNERIAIE